MITESNGPTDIFDEVDNKVQNEYLESLYNTVSIYAPSKNQIINAKFKGISSEQYIFSVNGFKDEIRVDMKQSEQNYIENLEIDDDIDLIIKEISNNPYLIKGSISELYEKRVHHELREEDSDMVVMARVVSTNPAGYTMEIMKSGVVLSGFMPNTLAGVNKLYDPDSIVGKNFEVMVESYSESEKTYIVSRKKYLKTLIPQKIEELDYDKKYNGFVTGTTKYGVFVQFEECLTGMIHKFNLREDWQESINEIKPGFEVEFYIKDIIKQKGKNTKIILTQILTESLWDRIENGEIMNGTVIDVKNFGALISLDKETVGLIRTQEMNRKGAYLEKDDNVQVQVLSVDRSARKIFLTTN